MNNLNIIFCDKEIKITINFNTCIYEYIYTYISIQIFLVIIQKKIQWKIFNGSNFLINFQRPVSNVRKQVKNPLKPAIHNCVVKIKFIQKWKTVVELINVRKGMKCI